MGRPEVASGTRRLPLAAVLCVLLVLGAKGLARAVVERKDRCTGERDEVAFDAVIGVLSEG